MVQVNFLRSGPGCIIKERQEPLREAALRSVSAIVSAKEEQDLTEIGTASIVEVVARKTRPLIGDMCSFENEPRSLLQDAADIWSLTQRSLQRIITFLKARTSADSPVFSIDEDISILGELSEERARAPILTFLTVLVVNTSKILHSGYALHASNPLVFSGTIVAEDQVEELLSVMQVLFGDEVTSRFCRGMFAY